MSVLVNVDDRGRVNLRKLGVTGLYLVHKEPSGTIVLTPAQVVVRTE